LILVSDANVLIDLGYVGAVSILPQLAETEVLDLVLIECEHPSQPGLVEEIKAAGIRVIAVDEEWITEADIYRADGSLSLQDRLNVHYAKTYQRTLLAGDLPVRDVCTREGIDLCGSLWIVQQAYERGLVTAEELLRWMKVWPEKGRRLPKVELKRLSDLLSS